jgi:hypothetical protein
MSVRLDELHSVNGVPLSRTNLVQLLDDHDSPEAVLAVNGKFFTVGREWAVYVDQLQPADKSHNIVLLENRRDSRLTGLDVLGVVRLSPPQIFHREVRPDSVSVLGNMPVIDTIDQSYWRGTNYESTMVVGVRKPGIKSALSPRYVPLRGEGQLDSRVA